MIPLLEKRTTTQDPIAAPWWQTGVIYQIYPRSFYDANGDGIGDLRGILAKLDYLQWLGVDAVWLSPIFPSPMADFGYDVADYTNIDPLFGTLADFDALLKEAHRCSLKLILDLVPNHSSDEHPWFVQSRSSRTNPKRDWYIWRDPAPSGGLPNNWQSFFGGDAWTLDPTTGQYYLHLFHEKQPDLNWRNPEVREAMYSTMRFWLERGVDGFRVDVMPLLFKDTEFRDNPLNLDWKPGGLRWDRHIRQYTEDLPEVQEVVREMRTLSDSYSDRVLIGETYLPIPRLVQYYGDAGDGAHLPFNFHLVRLPTWDAQTVRQVVDSYEAALPPGAWPNWVLGNHDLSRIASRVGPVQARIAQMLLLTLRGTPTCYYGDEIGMNDVPIPLHLVRDPQAGDDLPGHGRDPERTPMQWDDTPNAGFSKSMPWLPVAEGFRAMNVEAERNDPHSMLSLFQDLIKFRRTHSALSVGTYRSLALDVNQNVFAYLRESGADRLLVALNFGSTPERLDATAAGATGTVLCSTYPSRSGHVVLGPLTLRSGEGVVVKLPEPLEHCLLRSGDAHAQAGFIMPRQ